MSVEGVKNGDRMYHHCTETQPSHVFSHSHCTAFKCLRECRGKKKKRKIDRNEHVPLLASVPWLPAPSM